MPLFAAAAAVTLSLIVAVVLLNVLCCSVAGIVDFVKLDVDVYQTKQTHISNESARVANVNNQSNQISIINSQFTIKTRNIRPTQGPSCLTVSINQASKQVSAQPSLASHFALGICTRKVGRQGRQTDM
ncbi:hypothetical protein AWENTII_001818 [Aspergillus wentii]